MYPPTTAVITAPTNEQLDLLLRFVEELKKVLADGGRKRAAGTKVPWWLDEHKPAANRHWNSWETDGVTVDADSGAHPLAHSATRELMIVCQETGNVPVGDENV